MDCPAARNPQHKLMNKPFQKISAGKKAASTRKARNLEETGHLCTRQIEILKLARGAASSAIARARKNGIPVDDDFGHRIAQLLERQNWRCALTGIPFDAERTSEGAGGRDYAPSPDRRDPLAGYTAKNVQWILWSVNRAKGRMPNHHFEKVFSSLGKRIAESQQ